MLFSPRKSTKHANTGQTESKGHNDLYSIQCGNDMLEDFCGDSQSDLLPFLCLAVV